MCAGTCSAGSVVVAGCCKMHGVMAKGEALVCIEGQGLGTV